MVSHPSSHRDQRSEEIQKENPGWCQEALPGSIHRQKYSRSPETDQTNRSEQDEAVSEVQRPNRSGSGNQNTMRYAGELLPKARE